MRLNLGSGSDPCVPGVVNVDRAFHPNVDVLHDLDVLPWPFKDGYAEMIIAQDVFEHVGDPIGFMTESHRVLAPGGELVLKCPHYLARDAFTDPTHRRFCTEHTWDYWIAGTALFERHSAAYGGVSYALRDRQLVGGSIFMRLRKN